MQFYLIMKLQLGIQPRILVVSICFIATRLFADVAGALNGVAAIAGATVPYAAQAAVAGINADKDVEVAQINAATEKYNTDKVSSADLAKSALATGVSIYNAATTRAMNLDNQIFASQNQSLQLSALSRAQDQTYEINMRRLESEERTQNRLLDIQEDNARAAVELKRAQLWASLNLSEPMVQRTNSADLVVSQRSLSSGGVGFTASRGARGMLRTRRAANRPLGSTTVMQDTLPLGSTVRGVQRTAESSFRAGPRIRYVGVRHSPSRTPATTTASGHRSHGSF